MSEPSIIDLVSLSERYDIVKQKRLDHDRQSKRLKEEETALKQVIIDTLKKNELPSTGCKTVILTLTRKPYAKAENWDEIHKFIIENDAWDLVQRRLSEDAVRQRMLDGPIAGVSIQWNDNLSEARAKLKGMNDE